MQTAGAPWAAGGMRRVDVLPPCDMRRGVPECLGITRHYAEPINIFNMEDTGLSIPIDRETLREMHPRFPDALQGTFDPSSDDFVPEGERTRADVKPHIFDFMDGMRLWVSRHHSEEGLVIHAYCYWFDEARQPNRRKEGLKVMLKRIGLLLESLEQVDEAPAPVDVGLSENDVPHAFFPYPSPIFK